MNNAGTRLLVGAPGSGGSAAGAIYYYGLEDGEWRMRLPLPGLTSDENFGTSVAIISEEGETVAIGAPNYDGGSGVVRVYQRDASNLLLPLWKQLGPDIVGSRADRLGTTLCGRDGRVFAGTDNRSFKVYNYDSVASEWVETAVETGSPVVSIDMDNPSDVVVALENEEVSVYGFF